MKFEIKTPNIGAIACIVSSFDLENFRMLFGPKFTARVKFTTSQSRKIYQINESLLKYKKLLTVATKMNRASGDFIHGTFFLKYSLLFNFVFSYE